MATAKTAVAAAESKPVAAKKKSAAKKKPAKKKAPAKKKSSAKAKKPAAPKSKSPKTIAFDGDTSIRHVAKLLGYSDGTIRKDIETNGAPVKQRLGEGRAAVINIGEYHRFKLSQALGEGNSMADVKLERQREDVRKHKRENDLAEGKLVPIEVVVAFYQEFIVALSNRLDGIAGKSAAGDPEMRIRFLDEIRGAKSATFNDVLGVLREHSPGDGEALTATAASVLGVGSGEEDAPKG